MRLKLEDWKGGAGLRIPDAIAAESHLTAESVVDVAWEGGRLVVTPVLAAPSRLSVLLSGVTDENIHEEVSFGRPVGREAW